jgi:hypothetical protein
MGDGMTKQVSNETGREWVRLKDRLYWVVIGGLVASIAWMTMDTFGSGDGEGAPTIARESTPSASATTNGAAEDMATMDGMDHSDAPSPSSSSGGADVGTEPLDVCRQVYDDQVRPLRDAATAMDQWAVHVGAMNKLVVGAITLAQANQFWAQTRVGAMTNLQAFAGSDRQYQQRTYRCPPPAGKQAPGDLLDACERSVAARNRVLKLARVALATWDHHVMHMEMLRKGTMSPARATTLWLQSWRTGQGQIDHYQAALSATRGESC